MSYGTSSIVRPSNSTSTSSLSTVPRLHSVSKQIPFKVCVTHRDQSHLKYVYIWEDETLEQLKREIYEKLNLKTSLANFSLTVLEKDKCAWKPISEDNLQGAIFNLLLAPYSILNVEKREEINASEQQKSSVKESELTLKLCERPMTKSYFIYLTIRPSATISELKKQAQEKVTNQRTRHLSLWTKDEWTTFEATLEDVSIVELGFTNNSIISFQPKDDPVPGVCGLTNLGNTCFMNSALQCLSNIPNLTREILSSDAKMDAPIIGAYSQLIKTLWSGEHVATTPSSLLYNVCESLPRFTRYRQHDAHEFMNHFLHLIHQELTSEATIITDLFYGRIRSTVQCLGGCNSTDPNEETMTFVPLPIENDIDQYNILYLKSNGEQRFVTFHARAKTIDDLIQSFIEQHEPKLSPKRIRAVRIVDNSIADQYSSTTWLIDTTKHQLSFIEVLEKTVEQRYIEFQFHNRETCKPFRPPLILIRPSYGCRYSDLSEQIDHIQNHLRSTINAPNMMCRLYWINTYGDTRDLNVEKSSDEVMSFVDRVILEVDSNWAQQYMERYSCERSSPNASLNSLLADFFREEPLTGDYYCSQCSGLKKAKQKADLALPLPPVLIIQLKRFTYDDHSNDKLDTYIDFPIKDLDLSDYVAESDKKGKNMLALYDLVAVSNHSGNLASGHYTTYARNYRNKTWYTFNDDITREIRDEKEIVTRNAYILVYVQKLLS